jgi:phosphotransferase system  glucose/maltose/N-acetylglucosamine-specific IIC component
VIEFLKGGVPIIAVFIGLIAFFVGVADIKDKQEAKKEEAEEKNEKKADEGKGST